MARNLKSIVAEMVSLDEPSKPLYAEMEKYCLANGVDIEETFFTSGKQGGPSKLVVDAWNNNQEFQTWRAQREYAKKQQQSSLFYQDMTPEEFTNASKTLMSKYYRKVKDEFGEIQLYRIIDPDLKICQRQAQSRSTDLCAIVDTLKDILIAENLHLDNPQVARIYNRFKGYADAVPKPKLCSFVDDPEWSLCKVAIKPEKGSMHHIEEFLSRMNDPEAFAAWLYGIYSEKYKGRQILWLKGNGEDGKSTFMTAYCNALYGGIGPTSVAGTADWTQLKGNSTFIAESFVDKRFVYIPDNGNPYLLSNELIKSLANPGVDPVVINPKGFKAYSTYLENHCAVLSNPEPIVSDERSQVSRFLYVEVSERGTTNNVNISEEFQKEMAAFLAYGEECYSRLCSDDYKILQSEDGQAAVEDRLYDFSEKYQIVFDAHFILDPQAELSNDEFITRLRSPEIRWDDQEVGKFKKWLTRSHKISRKRSRHSNTTRVWPGLRLKSRADLNIEAQKKTENVEGPLV